jgi:hypothetical protein
MTDDVWIVVPNWQKFQHYRDRSPTWIKLYSELTHKHDWQQLSFADRGLLVTAWLAYASSDGVLHVSRMVALCGAHANAYGNVTKGLKRLSDAGFLELVASRPLALARSREKKLREEKKEPVAHARKSTPKPAATERRENAAAYRKHVPEHDLPAQLEPDPDIVASLHAWLHP